MSVTISLRVDESVKEQIEALGFTPGEFAREAVLKELKRERAKKALAWIWAHRIPAGPKSATQMIREDRDSR